MERNTARERKLTFHDGEYYEGSFKDGEVYGTSDSPCLGPTSRRATAGSDRRDLASLPTTRCSARSCSQRDFALALRWNALVSRQSTLMLVGMALHKLWMTLLHATGIQRTSSYLLAQTEGMPVATIHPRVSQ
jgi:hypothetical protein